MLEPPKPDCGQASQPSPKLIHAKPLDGIFAITVIFPVDRSTPTILLPELEEVPPYTTPFWSSTAPAPKVIPSSVATAFAIAAAQSAGGLVKHSCAGAATFGV